MGNPGGNVKGGKLMGFKKDERLDFWMILMIWEMMLDDFWICCVGFCMGDAGKNHPI